MSSNRLIYDDCASLNHTKDNKNQLSWIVDNNRFENSNNCMIDLGVNGGNTSTNNNIADRVDIESKLRGTGNYDSKCKGMSKIEEPNNVLPSCNFYNGSLKPANLDPNEVVSTRCNNPID
tara:strand:+ start:1372 stop:1731 length:360 start_codon:yes stop_codon:yes gene_type:complete